MIEVKNLCKTYGSLLALDDVSLTIHAGSITGILGPNGAGKTTLFKILTELIRPTSGEFSIASEKAKKVGAIIENPHLYEYLSAKENLMVFMQYQGLKVDSDLLNKKLEEVGLDPERTDRVKQFSLGMKQRLGIATALLNEPDALILDEPFLGLDPMGMKDLRQMMKNLSKNRSIAILVSSHQIEELSKACEFLYLLNRGRITSHGKTSDILHRATQKFKIKGPKISESPLFNDLVYDHSGETCWVSCNQNEAAVLVKNLINTGYQIDEFKPELNLENLYQNT